MPVSAFARLWATDRARMLEAAARGRILAAERKRARFPSPTTPEDKRLYSKLAKHLGAVAARKAMGLTPAPLGFSGTATRKGTERGEAGDLRDRRPFAPQGE